MDLSAGKIPQLLLRQLVKRPANYAESLRALDQVEGRVDRRAMLSDTLTALDQLPAACRHFRKRLPARVHLNLAHMERSVRKALKPQEAYDMVPGRNPENVQTPAQVVATPKGRQKNH